jgi:hypothetical protein
LSPSRREERLLHCFRLRNDETEMLGVTSPLVGPLWGRSDRIADAIG